MLPSTSSAKTVKTKIVKKSAVGGAAKWKGTTRMKGKVSLSRVSVVTAYFRSYGIARNTQERLNKLLGKGGKATIGKTKTIGVYRAPVRSDVDINISIKGNNPKLVKKVQKLMKEEAEHSLSQPVLYE